MLDFYSIEILEFSYYRNLEFFKMLDFYTIEILEFFKMLDFYTIEIWKFLNFYSIKILTKPLLNKQFQFIFNK